MHVLAFLWYLESLNDYEEAVWCGLNGVGGAMPYSLVRSWSSVPLLAE